MAFSFSSEKTTIDHLILRLEIYPQDRGKRPMTGPADPASAQRVEGNGSEGSPAPSPAYDDQHSLSRSLMPPVSAAEEKHPTNKKAGHRL